MKSSNLYELNWCIYIWVFVYLYWIQLINIKHRYHVMFMKKKENFIKP